MGISVICSNSICSSLFKTEKHVYTLRWFPPGDSPAYTSDANSSCSRSFLTGGSYEGGEISIV